MKIFFSRILFFVFILVFPLATWAHQPRIVDSNLIIVTDPEISKAYYHVASGKPATYRITSATGFALYVGLLVPDIDGQKKDISATITKDGTPITILDGENFDWKKFFEPFGHDTYWEGPQYRAQVGPGNYEIQVSSSDNMSRYSLAVGELEVFDFKEVVNAVTLIPQLKKNFFNVSPLDFIYSPFGIGLIVIMFSLGITFGLIYRTILKKFAINTPRGVSKNIGKYDRILRILISVGLLVFAMSTSWNPWLIFFSGFAFFEGLFSWCGLYAALGRNTCPVK